MNLGAGLLALTLLNPAAPVAPVSHHKPATTEYLKFKDARGCEYKWHIYGVGDNGFTVYGNTDTCGRGWWAVAKCDDGNNLYGPVRYTHNGVSATKGGCGAGNIGGLFWWGVRADIWFSKEKQGHRLFCLDVNTACNKS